MQEACLQRPGYASLNPVFQLRSYDRLNGGGIFCYPDRGSGCNLMVVQQASLAEALGQTPSVDDTINKNSNRGEIKTAQGPSIIAVEKRGSTVDRYFVAMITITFIFGGATYLMYRLTENRIVKYVPSLLLGGAAGYLIYQISSSRGSFEALALGLLTVLVFVGMMANIVTGLVLDFIVAFWRNRRAMSCHDQ